ncbi:hypothetical protein NPIL_47451 [Nephila pilipes]|uniref:Uncharacterized protein n=1 Tax=Nephila pilipes TaxID=299642 RepID=A0A8X6N095_NEPPI|nr:hypothetical protein NPIL_47451 [Nephila pilipes]
MDDSDTWASQIINELFEDYQEDGNRFKCQANQEGTLEAKDILVRDTTSRERINYNIIKGKNCSTLNFKKSEGCFNSTKSNILSIDKIIAQNSNDLDVSEYSSTCGSIEKIFETNGDAEDLLLKKMPFDEISSLNEMPVTSSFTQDMNDDIRCKEPKQNDIDILSSYNPLTEKSCRIEESKNTTEINNNSLAYKLAIQKSKDIFVNNYLSTCVPSEETFSGDRRVENLLVSKALLCSSPIVAPTATNFSAQDPSDDIKNEVSKQKYKTETNFCNPTKEEYCYTAESTNSLTEKSAIQNSKDIEVNNYLNKYAMEEETFIRNEHDKDLLLSKVPLHETLSPIESLMASTSEQDPNESIRQEESIYNEKTAKKASSNSIKENCSKHEKSIFEKNLQFSSPSDNVASNTEFNIKVARNNTEPLDDNMRASKESHISMQFTANANADSTGKLYIQLEATTEPLSATPLRADLVAKLILDSSDEKTNNHFKKKAAVKTVPFVNNEVGNSCRDLKLNKSDEIKISNKSFIVQSYRKIVNFLEICLIIPLATFLENYWGFSEFILAIIVGIIYRLFCKIKSVVDYILRSETHLIVKENNEDIPVKRQTYALNDHIEKSNEMDKCNAPCLKSKACKSSISLINFLSDTTSIENENIDMIPLDILSPKLNFDEYKDKVVGDKAFSTLEINVPNKMLYVNQLSQPLLAMYNESKTTQWHENSVSKKEIVERSISIASMNDVSQNIDYVSKRIESGTLNPSVISSEYFKQIEELGTISNVLGNTKLSEEKENYFSNIDSQLELENKGKVENETESSNILCGVKQSSKIQNCGIDFDHKNSETAYIILNDELDKGFFNEASLNLKARKTLRREDSGDILLEIIQPCVKEEIVSESKETEGKKCMTEDTFLTMQANDNSKERDKRKVLFDEDSTHFKNLEITHKEDNKTNNVNVFEAISTENQNNNSSFCCKNQNIIFDNLDELMIEDVRRQALYSKCRKMEIVQTVCETVSSEGILKESAINEKKDFIEEDFDPYRSIIETDPIEENFSFHEEFEPFEEIKIIPLDDKARNQSMIISHTSIYPQTSEYIADENRAESEKVENDDILITGFIDKTELNPSIRNSKNNGSYKNVHIIMKNVCSNEDEIQEKNDGFVNCMSDEKFPFLQSVSKCIRNDHSCESHIFEEECFPAKELVNNFTSDENKFYNGSLLVAEKSQQIRMNEKFDYEYKDDISMFSGMKLAVEIGNKNELDPKLIELETYKGISSVISKDISKQYLSKEFIPKGNFIELTQQNTTNEKQVLEEGQESTFNINKDLYVDIGDNTNILLDNNCLQETENLLKDETENLKEMRVSTISEQDLEWVSNVCENQHTDTVNIICDQHDSNDHAHINDINGMKSEFSFQVNKHSQICEDKGNEESISTENCSTGYTLLDKSEETAKVNENCSSDCIFSETFSTSDVYDPEESFEVFQEMGDGRCNMINISLEVNCSLESIESLSSDDDEESIDLPEAIKTNNIAKINRSISGYISLENSVDIDDESFNNHNEEEEALLNSSKFEEERLLKSKSTGLVPATNIECLNQDEVYPSNFSVPHFKSTGNEQLQSSSTSPVSSSSDIQYSIQDEASHSSEPFELEQSLETNVLETTVETPDAVEGSSGIKKKKGIIRQHVSTVWKKLHRHCAISTAGVEKGHKYKKCLDDS